MPIGEHCISIKQGSIKKIPTNKLQAHQTTQVNSTIKTLSEMYGNHTV